MVFPKLVYFYFIKWLKKRPEVRRKKQKKFLLKKELAGLSAANPGVWKMQDRVVPKESHDLQLFGEPGFHTKRADASSW